VEPQLTRDGRARPLTIALGLGCLLLGTLASCSNDGDRIVVVGDSITLTSGGALEESLADFDSDIRAKLGATVTDMLPAAQELAGTHPQQVLIDLGTNDVNHGTPTATTQTALTQMIGMFPDAECIYLVDINTHMAETGTPSTAAAVAANKVIAELARNDDRIEVIGWNQIVTDDLERHDGTSTLLVDTVHPNAEGQAQLADAMGDAFDRCGFPLT
jgi:lysophospholipase L1-like esterase